MKNYFGCKLVLDSLCSRFNGIFVKSSSSGGWLVPWNILFIYWEFKMLNWWLSLMLWIGWMNILYNLAVWIRWLALARRDKANRLVIVFGVEKTDNGVVVDDMDTIPVVIFETAGSKYFVVFDKSVAH